MDSPTEYMLRVAADEIEHLERQSLPAFPHIERFINRPAAKFLLRHLQNFCWTMERVWSRIRRRYVPPQAVQPLNLRPHLPAGCLQTCRPRIWVDVTNTYRTGFGGGIGRVAMQLARTGAETGFALPVIIENGRIRPYFRTPDEPDELRFDPDVIYVIVDSFWQQTEEYVAVCETAHAAGASIVTCFHDVIPLYYPNFNRSTFASCFAKSFAEIIQRSDACIAVSQYTARNVRAYVESLDLRPDRPLPLAYFYLGADGHVGSAGPRPVREQIRNIFARPNVFLSVGTLEPRKGYPISLDAFDKLWRSGVDCSFVIIGRPGWISKSLEKRIVEHPHAGSRLHWLSDVEDIELTFAYRSAHCLVQASITEGFGLPIVEANHEGTPVIAAETDVFRELAGTAITYFRNCDSDDLASKLADAVRKRPAARPFNIPTWKESLAQMVNAIDAALAERAAMTAEAALLKTGTAVFNRRGGSPQVGVLNARMRSIQSRRR